MTDSQTPSSNPGNPDHPQKPDAAATPPAFGPNQLALDKLPPGQIRRVLVGKEPVAVVNVDGELFAVSDTCTHANVSLAGGFLEGHKIVCPWHYAMFDVRNGVALSGPACDRLRCFAVTIEGNKVSISDRA